jgi:DNA polymerase III epsilon subunit-like protein
MADTLIFDTETNAIQDNSDFSSQTIMQWAWSYNDITCSYLLNHVRRMNSQKTPHSLTVKQCKEHGRNFKDVYNEFIQLLRECPIVIAHNVKFDQGVISYELKRHAMLSELAEFNALMSEKSHCTMMNTINLCKIPKTGYAARYPGYKYPQLLELYLHIFHKAPPFKLHDAEHDVIALKHITERLAELGEGGLCY